MTVLYSKPGCAQCTATERRLNGINAEFTVVDLVENADAVEKIKDLGYLQAPVVYVGDDIHWSGYRPDLIEKHIA